MDFYNRDSYKYPYEVSSNFDQYKWVKYLIYYTLSKTGGGCSSIAGSLPFQE